MEEIVDKFIYYVNEAIKEVDYSNKESVKNHNRYIEEYRLLAKNIIDNYGSSVLIDVMNKSGSLYLKTIVATCIIDFKKYDKEQYDIAVKQIEDYVNNSDDKIRVIGYKAYLNKLNERG